MIARSINIQILSFCLLLFASCMIMHGELYRLRPPTRSLTAFYLCVSFGGAMGGIFVGVLAPVIFSSYFELELGISFVVVLLLVACANDPSSRLSAGAPRWRWAIVGPLAASVLGFVGWQTLRLDPEHLSQQRGFFGVVRISQVSDDQGSQRMLTHGSTLHGTQYVDGPNSKLATTYFGKATAVGLALDSREPAEQTRVGVIGLGVGTLAAYGRTGDLMRFYEIDPAVINVARDSGDFSYLKDSAAEIEVILRDARISMAEERIRGARQDYDLLIVDAFNSDTVPVHLMTLEMFVHYKAALAPNGVLAFHVSNRHLDLVTLVTRMGMEVELESIRVHTLDATEHFSFGAKWVFLCRDRNQINKLARTLKHRHRKLGIAPERITTNYTRLVDVAHSPVWTDDYSDLYSLLKRKW